MPAQVSHIIAAEEALRLALPELAETWGIGSDWGLAKDCADDRAAAWFRFGAQGPDIFYHNQRTKPSGIHYGALAHRRNYGLAVEAMTAALIEAKAGFDSREAAWLLGFATHAAVDRAIHPFIVHFAGWQSPLIPESARYRSCHPFLERLLDIHILGTLRGLPIGSCNLEGLLPLGGRERCEGSDGGSFDAALGRLLAKGLRAAFPAAAGADFLIERRIQNAIADAKYFIRVTNPSLTSAGSQSLLPWFDDLSGWRSMALIYPEKLPTGLDVANEEGKTWEHPAGDGRSYTASHGQLFDEAIASAAAALILVAEAIAEARIGAGFASAIGNGGLSVADEDGIPVPPRVSKPLPLKEVMEEEFARRIRAEQGLAAGRV